jgi:hypothetical protein
VLRPAGARERGDGVEGVSFTEFASVQEQVEQIEGRNHTHAVDKRGTHCAVAVMTYHRPRSRAGVIWWLGQPPRPGNRVRTLVVPDRAGADSLTARPVARVVLRKRLNEALSGGERP